MPNNTLLKKIQSSSKDEALKLVESGIAELDTFSAQFSTLFPHTLLSEAKAAFASSADAGASAPDTVVNAVGSTVDVLDIVISKLVLLERYIYLTIPKMEDGNNFGVTVQLAALKQMNDDREYIVASIDELSKYYQSRADIIEKCKLPTTTKSKTSSNSAAEMKGGEKPGSTEESKTETKTIETEVSNQEQSLRQQAVYACDVLYYSKAKTCYQKAVTHYMTAIDFMDKNSEKLEKPKGAQGGGHFSSMY